MANVFGVSGDQLKQFIEKIERLEQEKAEVSEYIREAFAEAKGFGFDPKIMRQLIKERKMDMKDVEEQETLLAMYKRALGMLPELDEAA
jgi:uncharacterized protein (UPF0335 family)